MRLSNGVGALKDSSRASVVREFPVAHRHLRGTCTWIPAAGFSLMRRFDRADAEQRAADADNVAHRERIEPAFQQRVFQSITFAGVSA